MKRRKKVTTSNVVRGEALRLTFPTVLSTKADGTVGAQVYYGGLTILEEGKNSMQVRAEFTIRNMEASDGSGELRTQVYTVNYSIRVNQASRTAECLPAIDGYHEYRSKDESEVVGAGVDSAVLAYFTSLISVSQI